MTDLLTPDKVREVLAHAVAHSKPMIARLCRDYLTLWDRVKDLEIMLADADQRENERVE